MAISHKSLCNVKIALHKGHPRATFPDATIRDTRGTGCLYIISLLETARRVFVYKFTSIKKKR